MSNVTHSAGASALIELQIATSSDPVSGLFFRPAHPRAMLVFAHGAGAGMRHGFMASMADCEAVVAFGFPLAGSLTADPSSRHSNDA